MPDQSNVSSPLSQEAQRYYMEYDEAGRLFRRVGQIERVRTQELIARSAPPAPATVYDIGGGPGVYALWLAQRGYTVHLLDAVPQHIEQAREASDAQPHAPLASLQVGDARHLPFAANSADVVLLLGPLYHLIDRADRLVALREAKRVLRPRGVLFAAAISRFASLLDNLNQRSEIFTDPTKAALILEDLTHGQHRNPTGELDYFTTTYFHHPDELQAEVNEAGLSHSTTFAVEGPLWLTQDALAHWSDPRYQEAFLAFLRVIEREPTLIGASSHFLAVAYKEAGTSIEPSPIK
jgi:ubiquinone/menaquinone biosynthesis C-methylase UbiE